MKQFSNRLDAGKQLADVLRTLPNIENARVLALPRGGVPVGYAVAKELDLPLDVLVVRKLGVPYQPELAMGAIASGGIQFLDHALIRNLGISETQVNAVIERERRELQQREKYYSRRTFQTILDHHVILIDDGIATGSTMFAAIDAVRSQAPESITVAVPVAPTDMQWKMKRKADQFICLDAPVPFYAVGSHYEDFTQTSDEEVSNYLQEITHRTENKYAGAH